MSNCVKIYVDKFEEEEEYDNLLYSVIGDIQNEIEESIRNGEWYKKITYEIEELKDYDNETIENIIADIFNYDGEDFTNKGFKVDMEIDGYTLDYYIVVDTDVKHGHLDYNLMEKLFDKHYLNNDNIVRYVKIFNQYNSVIFKRDNNILIINVEEQERIIFYIDIHWHLYRHYIEE